MCLKIKLKNLLITKRNIVQVAGFGLMYTCCYQMMHLHLCSAAAVTNLYNPVRVEERCSWFKCASADTCVIGNVEWKRCINKEESYDFVL